MTDEKLRPATKPLRTDQARQVAEEYANDQREIIKQLDKPAQLKGRRNGPA
jgi:hypothetical protein